MIKQVLVGMVVILALTACNPEQGKPSTPHQRAPENQGLSDVWFLGRVFDGQHKERGGVPIHVRGEVIGVDLHHSGHVEPGPGCQAAGTDAMICTAPTAQLITIEGAGSIIMTFSFFTNAVGWQMQCIVSPNQSGVPIFDQDTSDRTGGRGMEEASATCSFP